MQVTGSSEPSTESLRATLDAAPGAFVVFSSDGVALFANARFRAVLASTPLIEGRRLDELIPLDAAPCLSWVVDRVSGERAPILGMRYLHTAEGAPPRPFTLHASPVTWEGTSAVLLAFWESELEAEDGSAAAPDEEWGGEYVRLCDFLHDHREEILAAWEQAVRLSADVADVPSPVLRDELPALLDRIAEVVRTRADAGPPLVEVAEKHALERLDRGVDLGLVAGELALLRRTALRLWRRVIGDRADHVVLEEVERFDSTLDEVLARSVERYSAARERTLVALDRLSAVALGAADAETFLPRLLQVVLETNEAADSAQLFLRDGDRLTVRAAEGIGAATSHAFTLRIGEGLVGRVAATGEPLLVHATGSDPRVVNPDWRGTAIQALYGVPLLHGGEVIGVACMGSTTAHDFSVDDKQLFRAMAERATAIIVKQRIEERLRNAEVARRRSEADLGRFFEISAGLMWIAGPDGFLRRTNPAFRSLLGWSDEELATTPYLELVHPDDRERVHAEESRVMRGKVSVGDTFRLRRKDGSHVWVLANSAADPESGLVASVGQDVTGAKARAEFEQQLIGIVSHDLRNPVSAIVVAADTLLLRRGELDALSLRSVRRIRSSAQSAMNLIRDLLDFTRARVGGGIPIVREELDIHSHVRSVAEEVRASHPGRTIRYEQRGPGVGQWDPSRIAQVVSNLVSNAFRHGAADGDVVVRSAGGPDAVVLEVQNQGPPIDPALLPHLFEPLRAGRADGGGASVGLGLYIVDQIVRAHGGELSVRSSEAEGTTFTVRLPHVPAPG